jgi:glycosyltransferase involved in cell wall biosynthesis
VRLTAIQHFNGSDFAVRIPLPFVVEREIEAFAPDIIHSHHPFLLGDTALRVARQKGLPLVFTHHTLYERYIHYIPLESDKLVSFVVSLTTLYANFCDDVIAPSRSLARLIRQRGVRTPISEIPTGVNVDMFARGSGNRFRKKHGIPADALVVGHLGRLAAEKNLDYLVEAVRMFIGNHPQAVFLVVGDGPRGEAVNRAFDRAGLRGKLFMPGCQTGDALADAYRAMDLFVFASLSETQGLVLAEAMAAGLPVIALDASGARDIVEEGVNGRLLPRTVPPGAFAAAIEMAIADDRMMQRWRAEAVKTAHRHARQVSAQKLADLYAKILQRDNSQKSREELSALDSLTSRIKLEWALLSGKIKSVVEAVPATSSDESI